MPLIQLNRRVLLVFAHDVAASAIAWPLAFWLRFNMDLPDFYRAIAWETLLVAVPLQAAAFIGFKLYRGIWRYASLPDVRRILLAVTTSTLLIAATITLFRISEVPRSVLILDPLLLFLMMCGSRVAYRGWKENRLAGDGRSTTQPVLVLGAGAAALTLLRELAYSNEWRVVGLLDDNRTKHNRQVHGVNILGGFDEIEHWSKRLGVGHAIIALPSTSHQVRRRAVELCNEAELEVMTVPAYQDLMSGRVTVAQLRAVELEDLLGRDPVILDLPGLKEWFAGRVVMVTGAGGSIGSEICRQVAGFDPSTIVLFDHSEFALYQIEQEFRDKFTDTRIVCAVGDVKSRYRLQQIMRAYRPFVVFHAAAYKHVPLMEECNSWEAVRNNTLGTYILATTAIEFGVSKMVLISTDKAVNPTSVMGATKRLAEQVCQCLHQRGSTRFISVRFGNVLGSAGSVVPKFRAQIARGGPITVTHPDIRRFFMSIPEATQLVLQAGLMGSGGEIFILDMGELIKIDTLARDLIRLSGYSEDEIRIEYTGLRPGEKLYEELLITGENSRPTPHPKLRMAISRPQPSDWLSGLYAWISRAEPVDDDDTKRDLARWIPEFCAPAEASRPVASVSNLRRTEF
jgi:FlaA1/EpsC-like NDP-sugar epimerase